MLPDEAAVNYLSSSLMAPAGTIAIAFDRDGSVYAFFDIPVVCIEDGWWATSLAGPDFAPVLIGDVSESNPSVCWDNSLVIVDEEARWNYNESLSDEAFDNAKDVTPKVIL